MQEIHSSNSPVVTGICDPNKSRARHHRSLKLGSKLKYLKKNYTHFVGLKGFWFYRTFWVYFYYLKDTISSSRFTSNNTGRI